MNTVVTSKEAILKVCREMVAENGISALNMRSVAENCHIALGSLYNYFSNKDTLVIATIESIWQDIFHMDCSCDRTPTFLEYVRWIFDSVQNGAKKYPNFFTAHSLSITDIGKSKARVTMNQYLSDIKMGMLKALNSDTSIRKDAFLNEFTDSDFIDFILMNIIVLLMQQKSDCNVLLETIRRTIYNQPALAAGFLTNEYELCSL